MLLNSTQARKIFDKYSFIAGTEDVIKAIQIEKLFGYDAVIYAFRNRPDNEVTAGQLDLGEGYSCICFNYTGFLIAVDYYNKQELLNHEKIIHGNKPPEVKDEEWHEVKEDSKVISFEERRRQA